MTPEMKNDGGKGGKRPNKYLIIALIALGACIIIAASVFAVVRLTSGGKAPEREETPTEDVTPEPEPEPEPEPDPDEGYEKPASAGALAALDGYDPKKDTKYNLLLMGVDRGGSLTDVLMVYQFDRAEKKVKVLSVPRDTKVTFNGHAEKINAVHAYGRKLSDPNGGDRADEYAINAVRDLTGIPIHHFACINLQAFRDIIDALDGFDFEVPRSMNYDDRYQNLHIHLNKGMQHLDGAAAEQLVRFRRYQDGDIGRVQTQQAALRALIAQKANSQYIDKIPEIYEALDGNITTDLTPVSAINLANDLMAAGEEGLTADTLPGSFSGGEVSYWLPDRARIDALVSDMFGV